MNNLAPIKHIEKLAEFLLTTPPGLDPEVSIAMSNRLNRYLHAEVRIETALELEPNGVDPRVLLKVEQRNEFLCDAATLLTEVGHSARAKRLHSALLQYFNSASWKSDRLHRLPT